MGRTRDKWKKNSLYFAILSVMLLLMFFGAVNTGGIKISFGELFRGLFVKYNKDVEIIFDLRFPRIVIAMLSGAALAVSGVLLQAVMKNPLADPGIIGISAGAGFFAALVILILPGMFFFMPLFAFAGGIIACGLVYGLSWKSGLSPIRIILVGVAVNAVFSGLLNSLGYMSSGTQSSIITSITNTSIAMKTWADADLLKWYVVIGLVLSMLVSGRCNILSLEDKTVRNLGVNVNLTRLYVSGIAVLLASIATAVVGSISFVGLIVPHIARLLVGSNHRILIPFSVLLGSFTVLFADTVGRTIFYPYEIPASIVMAVVGGPFFIYLLRRSEKIYGS